ncbi:mycofactocin-coupled SDR family oxidoreductase [Mycolicibacterium sp. CBMA 226]|uniref:mycofactocin-coupled SDR family oxidoreductase n=1 Tax=Mycolicibacterium sp. CBMA 226 TaxID=2606611 RepID=UPI0012DF7D06|nr:mycofactocin-coupled SDR family oxidoreductase [Mycolicibacterium sp. CBMA 226]MUL74511.1 mycofactocin-coupled SDR family oxidoreductase [Mycolicibacterium sp. CBMA 226]
MGVLDGKVALVSGAARGQGRSHAVKLASLGADIIAFDICANVDSVEYPLATPADLEETVKLVSELDRRIVASVADVRDMAAVQKVVDEGAAELGGIDIVLANAGIMPITGEVGQRHQSFIDAIDIMLVGVFNTVTAAEPYLLGRAGGGSIVITSSTSGLKALGDGTAGVTGYVAAKHGVVGLMRSWAKKLGPKNIRVNTIHPTGVNSPMVANEAFGRYVAEHPEIAQDLQNVLPVELLEVGDVSEVVAFLCSPEGRFIHGHTLVVDAGFTIR